MTSSPSVKASYLLVGLLPSTSSNPLAPGTENVANTVVAWLSVNVHVVDVAMHPPVQPVNTLPAAALAVSCTDVPLLSVVEQVIPQLIPPTLLVTVPEPLPWMVTVSVDVVPPWTENDALTLFAKSIVTWQLPVPEQAPVHPAKLLPAAGDAFSVTSWFGENEAEHVAPQSMPAGVLVTVPEPDLDTLSIGPANVAVTLLVASIVTWQAPVPLQAPAQPVNVLLLSANAWRLTRVFWTYEALHVTPQLMPAGLLVTVPVPLPALFTVSESWVALEKDAVTSCARDIVTWQIGDSPVQAPSSQQTRCRLQASPST